MDDLVYRIWDDKLKRWYKSNRRDIWTSAIGVASTYGRLVKYMSKRGAKHEYQIKRFKLVEDGVVPIRDAQDEPGSLVG